MQLATVDPVDSWFALGYSTLGRPRTFRVLGWMQCVPGTYGSARDKGNSLLKWNVDTKEREGGLVIQSGQRRGGQSHLDLLLVGLSLI